MKKFICILPVLFFFTFSFSQTGGGIRTQEGYFITSRNLLMAHCLEWYHTNENNSTAKQLCSCQIELLDGRYSAREINQYQRKYKDSGLFVLLKTDKEFQKELDSCIGNITYTSFLKLPASAQKFKDTCKASFKRALLEKYNDAKVDQFCSCAVDVLKNKNLTKTEFEDLYDVNSLLYNEVNYYCKDPFVTYEPEKWQASSRNDIEGPKETDTLKMISIGGMQKLKIRLGGMVKVALLDCGATDLLVPGYMVEEMLADSVQSQQLHFIDTAQYEMANGSSITCKRYHLAKIQLGSFTINNVILASTEKNVTILFGRTVLNKFRRWNVDNEKNLLILEK